MPTNKKPTVKQPLRRRASRQPNAYEQSKRDKRREAEHLRTIEQMTTPEIIGRLYTRHETRIWQVIAIVLLFGIIAANALTQL